MQTILIIEDDRTIAANIVDYIQAMDASLQCSVAYDGVSGFSMAATDSSIGLIVLDVGLPDISGVNVATRLRNIGWGKPIIMLTARDTVEDKIRGLDAGADDYVTKPFSLAELLARIRANLRRSMAGSANQVLRIADLEFNLLSKRVTRGGISLKLNATSLKILELLMKRSPGVLTHEDLVSEVWMGVEPSSEAIRSQFYMLRNSVDRPFEKKLIKTLPSIGWTIRE